MATVTLFEISTDRVLLRWDGPDARHHSAPSGHAGRPVGTLRVSAGQRGARVRVNAVGLPEYIAGEASVDEGPPLYEETTYHVSIHSIDGATVELNHENPAIISSRSQFPGGNLLASVNFRGQVGYSRFEVVVDGVPEFAFVIEVFPSKIEYKQDYDAMLAEITSFFVGLALDYLRATYRHSDTLRVPDPSQIEWLTILRQVVGQLESASRRIAQQPRRRLLREHQNVRVEKIRRVEGSVRKAVLRGHGRGTFKGVPFGAVREYLPEQRPVESLDTPEHRWLRSQLVDIRYRIASLIRAERGRQRELGRRGRASAKSQAILQELESFESTIGALLRLEPFASAHGDPPANFSSLLLQAVPGYREAYTTCLILRLGLRLEGGPLKLSLKDIHTLYEYWCYLAVLQLLAEQLDVPIDPATFLRITSSGIRVELEKGSKHSVVLSPRGEERPYPVKVELTYNPSFDSDTGQQRPDVGLAIQVDGWRDPFQVILDAKYRIENSPDYMSRHGSAGPPEDAVNVLHRYRDAILFAGSQGGSQNEALESLKKRGVIVGAALFPLKDRSRQYENHTFYRSLESVGIGALPFLPSRKEYVRDWLRQLLSESGWTLADRVLDHRAATERAEWMREASEPVLIAVIRPGVNHLEWIISNRLYYAPLARLGKRKFAARWIAIYVGRRDRGGEGAITHEAEVLGVDVMPRSKIKTPWAASHSSDELQVVYTLGEVREREYPILIEGGVRAHRWASRLSLRRARSGKELFLETEPEWRLYDELRARGIDPQLRSGEARILDPDDPRGRAYFSVGSYTVRYAGADGFRMERRGNVIFEPSVKRVLERIELELTRAESASSTA